MPQKNQLKFYKFSRAWKLLTAKLFNKFSLFDIFCRDTVKILHAYSNSTSSGITFVKKNFNVLFFTIKNSIWISNDHTFAYKKLNLHTLAKKHSNVPMAEIRIETNTQRLENSLKVAFFSVYWIPFVENPSAAFPLIKQVEKFVKFFRK